MFRAEWPRRRTLRILPFYPYEPQMLSGSLGSPKRRLLQLLMDQRLFLKSGRWTFVLRQEQTEFPKSIGVQTASQVVASSPSSSVGIETSTSPPIFDLIFLKLSDS